MTIKKEIDCVKLANTKYFFAVFLLVCHVSYTECLETFDFIVVGGGTSGCAVARRLAEGRLHTVLLVESGGLPKPGMDIPAYAPTFVQDADATFQYRSTPQENAARSTDGVVTPIAGRVLGGSSTLNYLWYNRGSPRDYDYWANVTGDSSWRYSNMLEHFKRAETYTGDYPSDQHGYNGPITVSRPRYVPGLDFWLQAGKDLGYAIADTNGPQRISFGPVEYAKRNGRRVSSFSGYIEPILPTTPNLYILTNTNATQIIFDGKKAIGIRFQTRSHPMHLSPENIVYANKEIIISAGAYESPLLLQRSGIGPKDVLRAANISIIKELPVGENFQDHVSLGMNILINDETAVMNETRDLTPGNLEYFDKYGDGPFSNTRGGGGQAFIASSVAVSEGEGDWPDIHLGMAHSTEPYLSANILGNRGTVGTSSEVPMSSTVFLVRPKSRGSIKVNPKDPYNGPPIIDVGYFKDPSDPKRMFDGLKETLRIFEETPSYRRLGAHVLTVDYPACQTYELRSDEYWQCYIREASQAGLHSGGTCKMGKGAEDSNAVVDPTLRVIGVLGLRVADASIMPTQTNANTHAACYGIAEKAAHMILKDWS